LLIATINFCCFAVGALTQENIELLAAALTNATSAIIMNLLEERGIGRSLGSRSGSDNRSAPSHRTHSSDSAQSNNEGLLRVADPHGPDELERNEILHQQVNKPQNVKDNDVNEI